MSGVPNQPIVAKVKDTVHRQAEFNDAQIRGKMSGADAEQATQDFTDFLTNLLQVAKTHRVQLMRGIDLFQ